MIPSECGQLLRACAFFDNRKVSEEAMIAWSKAIDETTTPAEAVDAVAAHYAETTDWVMPSHVNTRVRAIRRARWAKAGPPPFPGGLSQQQEKAWRQLWCAKVKDGESPDAAARAASEAMRLPPELTPVAVSATERDSLIRKWAESKGIPS